jgi:hypothetical protein
MPSSIGSQRLDLSAKVLFKLADEPQEVVELTKPLRER